MRWFHSALALVLIAHALWSTNLSGAALAATLDEDVPAENLTVLDKWRIIQQSLNQTAASLVKQALPILVRSTDEVDVTDECRAGILQILNGAKALKIWAFQFLDSFGKPPGGLLTGSLSAFGSYDQCLAISVPDDENPSKTMFRGQYCTLELRPPLPPKPNFYSTHHRLKAFENFTDKDSVLTTFQESANIFYVYALRFGLCIPSVCTIEDVRGIGTIVGEMMHFETRVPNCEVSEPRIFTVPQIVAACAIGLWVIFIFAITVADVILSQFVKPEEEKKKEKGKVSQMISSLSLFGGIQKAVSSDSSVDVKIFHGVRFLSIVWIILGNVFIFINYQPLQQLAEAQSYSQVFLFQCFFNSALGVDTLFFVSAFMTGYVIKNKQKSTKWMVTKMVFHKLWRWTPVMMFMVGIAILQPLTTRGPLAKETFEPLYQSCVTNWWANLLYLNNLVVRYQNRCLPNSWYFSCEMQLFLIGLLFIKMWNSSKRNLGIVLACLCCLVSMVVTGAITAYFQFPPTVLFSQVDKADRSLFEDAIHQKPYPHFTTWIIGLALGYYLSNRARVTLSWYVWLSGWFAWLISINAVVFGIYEWNRADRHDFAVSALYSAAHRGVWALALAWLTFCCFNGKITTIFSFLSWNAWVPLSRVTLWAYLLHSVIQQTVEGHIRERLHSTSFMCILLFFGFLVLTYLLSILCYVFVELPLVRLETMMVDWCRKHPLTQCQQEPKKSNMATTSCSYPPPVGSRVKPRPTRESQQPLAVEEVLSHLEFDNTGFENKV